MWIPFIAGTFVGMLADKFMPQKKQPIIAQHTVALGQGYEITLQTSDNPSLGKVLYTVVRDKTVSVAMGYTNTPEEAVLKGQMAMAADLAAIKLNT